MSSVSSAGACSRGARLSWKARIRSNEDSLSVMVKEMVLSLPISAIPERPGSSSGCSWVHREASQWLGEEMV